MSIRRAFRALSEITRLRIQDSLFHQLQIVAKYNDPTIVDSDFYSASIY